MRILFFGLGQTAKNLILELQNKKKTHISLVSRSNHINIKKFYELKDIPFDKKITSEVSNATHILISLPPPYENFICENLKDQINSSKELKWLGYLSSTSVYGNHNGQWVDENSKANPKTTAGINRLNAEMKIKELNKNRIFRLSGIYSDHQNVFTRIKSKQIKIVKNKNNYFSRIHLDDITQTLLNSFEKSEEDNIYNVSDDLPCPYKEIVKYACKLLKIDFNFPEINIDKIESSFLSDFYKDNKRVKNEKIKKILNVQLKYPTYKEGLNSILKKT